MGGGEERGGGGGGGGDRGGRVHPSLAMVKEDARLIRSQQGNNLTIYPSRGSRVELIKCRVRERGK